MHRRFFSGSCDLCMALLKSVENIAEEERNEKTISSVLEKVCDELPVAVVEAPCKMLIQSVLLTLADAFDSKMACTNLKFCSEENVEEERDLTRRANQDDLAVFNCTACEFSVKSLQTMAAQRKTRDFSLRPICESLPGVPGMVCKTVDAIINSDKKSRDFVTTRPRELCKDAQMCALPTIPSVPSQAAVVSTHASLSMLMFVYC